MRQGLPECSQRRLQIVDRFAVGRGTRQVQCVVYSVDGGVQMTADFISDFVEWLVEPTTVSAIEPLEILRLGGFEPTEQAFEYLGAVRTLNQMVGSWTGNVSFRGFAWRGVPHSLGSHLSRFPNG